MRLEGAGLECLGGHRGREAGAGPRGTYCSDSPRERTHIGTEGQQGARAVSAPGPVRAGRRPATGQLAWSRPDTRAPDGDTDGPGPALSVHRSGCRLCSCWLGQVSPWGRDAPGPRPAGRARGSRLPDRWLGSRSQPQARRTPAWLWRERLGGSQAWPPPPALWPPGQGPRCPSVTGNCFLPMACKETTCWRQTVWQRVPLLLQAGGLGGARWGPQAWHLVLQQEGGPQVTAEASEKTLLLLQVQTSARGVSGAGWHCPGPQSPPRRVRSLWPPR